MEARKVWTPGETAYCTSLAVVDRGELFIKATVTSAGDTMCGVDYLKDGVLQHSGWDTGLMYETAGAAAARGRVFACELRESHQLQANEYGKLANAQPMRPMPVYSPHMRELGKFFRQNTGQTPLEVQEDLAGAIVARFNYMSDGPGYAGDLFFVCFSGQPEFNCVLIRDKATGELKNCPSEISQTL